MANEITYLSYDGLEYLWNKIKIKILEIEEVASDALNGSLKLSGGTMTGTITSQSIIPTTTAAYDLGAYGKRFRYGYFSGSVYAAAGFYESSDERLKDFGDDIEVDLDKLSHLSKKYFTWKDDKTGVRQIGISAQEIQKLYPELVNTSDEEGYLSVSYDKLSVIALKGIDVLNDKVKSLEERITKLEKLIDTK